jgi:hypothetical protein
MPETHVANNQGFHYTRFRVNPGIARSSLKLNGGFPNLPMGRSPWAGSLPCWLQHRAAALAALEKAIMLGWHISVYRQLDDRSRPAKFSGARATRLAVWQTGLDGLDWIEQVARSRGYSLGGNGYPCRYTAQARDVLPAILAGPPSARNPWRSDPGDSLGPNWVGHTLIDHALAKACDPEEWLLIEAWDES